MKIKKIVAENIYSYKEMKFDFDKFPGGTTLILGKNLDQATGNGAGKTSLIKALYFGFFGEDVYKANKSSIIRRGSNSFYLKIEFEDKGHHFAIERFEGRKDLNQKGSGVNFYVDGDLFNGDGGVEAVQKNINAKIKISPTLFLSSVYAAQESRSSFLLASDTAKKDLLSEMLDLKMYAKAFDYVKEQIDDLNEKQKDRDQKIANHNDQISNFEEQVKELVLKQNGFDDEVKKTVDKLRKEYAPLKIKLEELEKNLIPKLDKNKIISKINDLKKEKEEIELKISEEHQLAIKINQNEISKKQIESDIIKLKQSIKNLTEEIKKLDSVVFEELKLKQIKEEISSLNETILKNEENKSKLNELKLSQSVIDSDINSLIKDINRDKKEIEDLVNSETCPSCLRPLEKEHIEHLNKKIISIKENLLKNEASLSLKKTQKEENVRLIDSIVILLDLENKLKKLSTEETELLILEEKYKQKSDLTDKNNQLINEKSLEVENLEKSLLTIEKEILIQKDSMKLFDSFKTKRKELIELDSSLQKELTQSEVELLMIEKNKEQIENLKESMKKIQESAEAEKQKKNPYGEMILSVEKKIMILLEKNKSIETNKLKDEKELKILKFWKVGFAPTGIRSFITDDVIDLLNKKVQENLNDLFNGALSVFFDPESKNNKGVVSNKISTHFYLNGKETSLELLSGGEKRRIILATDLALTEIAESRAGTRLNVRFLDEQFDGMDSNGQIQAFRLFARLSKDKDGFFVISHDENFQNMCPNVVYIIKKNEVSQIVSAEQFRKLSINNEISDEFEKFEKTATITENASSEDKKAKLAEKLKQISKNKKEN